MKPKTNKKHLKLDRERIRVLDRQELDQVVGGLVPNQTKGWVPAANSA